MLIWDNNNPSWPRELEDEVALWSQYSLDNDSKVFSIPEMVEKNGIQLRSKYLAWIYELGNTQVGGKNIVDHLQIRSGFSFWWMSYFGQKANLLTNTSINDAIKALALRDLLIEHKVNSVLLVSSNSQLADCISVLCKKQKIEFKWQVINIEKRNSNFKKIYESLFPSFKAIIYLIWYVSRMWPLAFQKKTKKNSLMATHNAEVMFSDIFFYLDDSSLIGSRFSSGYWGGLVKKIAEWGIKTNWIHNYFRHSKLPSPSKAVKLTRKLSTSSNGLEFHKLTEQFFTFSSIFQVLIDYIKLRKKFYKLKKLTSKKLESENCFLWTLQANEWVDSICGKEAIKSCITISLIERAVGSLPHQKLGIYIQENQPWEMALIHMWRAFGHGSLIGTPNSTVRFWDLRYYYDPRIFIENISCFMPLPDFIAVNGEVAKSNLLQSGYPKNRIKEVEALRYSYLSKFNKKSYHEINKNKYKIVLVCGDFREDSTLKLLLQLQSAEAFSPTNNVYIFKPHPSCKINYSNRVSIKLKQSNDPLIDLLSFSDIVLTSNITAAAVDAYCLGIPIIQILDESGPNLSPLRGMSNVAFVSTYKDMANELNKKIKIERNFLQNYFFLDDSLPRWKKLLTQAL